MKQPSFFQSVLRIAIPVALQSMLQSSFSMIDQVMVGQLGSISIAAVGIAGKFAFLYSVVIGAVTAIAGIMIAQYIGQQDQKAADRSLCVNLLVAVGIGLMFTLLSLLIPTPIMRLYSKDAGAVSLAAAYLRIIAGTYLPIGLASTLSVMLRCQDRAKAPLIAAIASALTNTGLNYILIFGKLGAPALGVQGAAIASVASQWINALVIGLFFRVLLFTRRERFVLSVKLNEADRKQYLVMLFPVLVNEFLWGLGQNVFTVIYSHIGTQEVAAVALISPVESLLIGALSGFAQAAGILIGKRLGEEEYEKAYDESKLLMKYGFIGSLALSLLLILLKSSYVRIYHVEDYVRQTAQWLLVAFAVLAPFKVQNMILGGGIIRSGGKTKYIMWIDLMGTWLIGIPLGFLCARLFKLPVAWIYFVIGLEEIVRWIVSVWLFRSRKWIIKI
ncbi:MAG: MATE family efflux transporter [Oscillospiraceae bacterium]|nr:MATE family efflux transporter [Oscillospiraceae bacterium]